MIDFKKETRFFIAFLIITVKKVYCQECNSTYNSCSNINVCCFDPFSTKSNCVWGSDCPATLTQVKFGTTIIFLMQCLKIKI